MFENHTSCPLRRFCVSSNTLDFSFHSCKCKGPVRRSVFFSWHVTQNKANVLSAYGSPVSLHGFDIKDLDPVGSNCQKSPKNSTLTPAKGWYLLRLECCVACIPGRTVVVAGTLDRMVSSTLPMMSTPAASISSISKKRRLCQFVPEKLCVSLSE